jgi:hypothetical protein
VDDQRAARGFAADVGQKSKGKRQKSVQSDVVRCNVGRRDRVYCVGSRRVGARACDCVDD